MASRLMCLNVSLLVLVWTSAPAVAERMSATVGPDGLEALRWADASILADGHPRVSRVILERKRLGEDGYFQYEFETLAGANPQASFEPGTNRLTYAYEWGRVIFEYRPEPSRLTLVVTIQNTSDRTIADFEIVPLSVAPVSPVQREKQWHGIASLPDDFNVVRVADEQWQYLLCAETIMPLQFGFGPPRRNDNAIAVTLRGGLQMMEPGGAIYHHHGLPRVQAGESLSMRLSLLMAPAGDEPDALLADMRQAYREFHQPALDWPDRRPIGVIFLAQGRGPDNNPRLWLGDRKLDISTQEGLDSLRKRMLEQADRAVEVLRSVGAQGVIIWDPEGAENPHPTTYIGDPRMVKLVAPEMVDIYPEYFKRFTDAGFRVGVCIRPTQVQLTPATNAVDGDVTRSWSVQQYPQWIELDLQTDQAFTATELVCGNDRAYQFKIEAKASNDTEYRVVVDRGENQTRGTVDSPIRDEFAPVKARYVRLTVTGAHGYDGPWINIREFRVLDADGRNLAVNRLSSHSRPLGRAVGGHGTGAHDPARNPLNDDFSEIWPEGIPAKRFYPVVERMSRKIRYAQENWGCTLFYVDTNGVHRPVGEDQKMEWTLLDSLVWRELHRRHPDVLLIPEFTPKPGQLAYAASYLQPPYSPAITRAAWRKWLPGAFGVSYTVNLKPEQWDALRPTLLEGVRQGDSLFFRGWFGCSYNPKIKALFDEAHGSQEAPPADR